MATLKQHQRKFERVAVSSPLPAESSATTNAVDVVLLGGWNVVLCSRKQGIVTENRVYVR